MTGQAKAIASSIVLQYQRHDALTKVGCGALLLNENDVDRPPAMRRHYQSGARASTRIAHSSLTGTPFSRIMNHGCVCDVIGVR